MRGYASRNARLLANSETGVGPLHQFAVDSGSCRSRDACFGRFPQSAPTGQGRIRAEIERARGEEGCRCIQSAPMHVVLVAGSRYATKTKTYAGSRCLPAAFPCRGDALARRITLSARRFTAAARR